MKRIVVFFVAMIWVAVASGQRPVRDTLECPDSMYNQQYVYYKFIYDWCRNDILWTASTWYNFLQTIYSAPEFYGTDPDGSLTPDNPKWWEYKNGNGIYGPQFKTDRPLKIVGIAAPAYMEAARDTSFNGVPHPQSPYKFLNTRDTTLAGRITDSMILYKVVGDDLVELKSQGWRMDDPHRYIHLPPAKLGRAFRDHYAVPDTSAVVPLYEVMFKEPVVVEDSFVVAGTCLNNEGSYEWEVEPGTNRQKRMWLWNHNPTRYIRLEGKSNYLDRRREVWLKFRTMDWKKEKFWGQTQEDVQEGIWRFHVPMIFPIIDSEFDTVMCHEARNIRVAERTDSSATLMWDSGDGGPWEVAFGKITDQWEDFTFYTVSSPTVTLTGLEVGTIYFALVRSYCSVTHEFGDWSSPFEVEIYHQHDPGEPEGIDNEGDLSHFTRLMPNPASGVVSVLSSYRLNRIEVYDMKGEKVLEQKVEGIVAEFDVSGWAKGTYVVAMYLEYGVVTKKLVVR